MSNANTPEPLTALIIGCGAIAGAYDQAGGGEAIRTHAGAYRHDPRFRMTACVEPDAQRRLEFMAYWGIGTGFADLDACKASGMAFDVASLCSPTEYHAADLKTLLAMPVRAVFAEKPLCGSVEIVAAYAAAGIPLASNYLRRWDTGTIGLRDEIAAGEWGAVQAVTGHYAKGLLNCGSHMVDLLHFLIGPVAAKSVVGVINDYRDDDPTVTAILETAGGAPVFLVGCDGCKFFPFEVDLVMEKGRVSLEDLGGNLRRRWVRPHRLYPSQQTLDDGVWMETQLSTALAAAVAGLYETLTNDAPLVSDGVSALAAEAVCGILKEMAEEFQKGAQS